MLIKQRNITIFKKEKANAYLDLKNTRTLKRIFKFYNNKRERNIENI